MSKPKTLVNNLESKFLQWITVAAIFLASGLVLLEFFRLYSITFLIISVLLLIVINYEYLLERTDLLSQGVRVHNRMDYLYLIIGIAIIIQIFVICTVIIKCPRSSEGN